MYLLCVCCNQWLFFLGGKELDAHVVPLALMTAFKRTSPSPCLSGCRFQQLGTLRVGLTFTLYQALIPRPTCQSLPHFSLVAVQNKRSLFFFLLPDMEQQMPRNGVEKREGGMIIFSFILFISNRVKEFPEQNLVSSIRQFFDQSHLLTSTYISRNSSLFEEARRKDFLPPFDPLQIPKCHL